jgi:choline kinase
MSLTRAIILAAGVGSRLRPLTDKQPKCLLEVGPRTLIDHQMSALGSCGITDVVVVAGHCVDRLRDHLGTRVRYVLNEQYDSTNSLHSLWLASRELLSGALILNSDVLATPLLFEKLVRSPAPDAILVERTHAFEAEDMKVRLNGSLVVDFGKDLPAEHSHAHNVGMAKFSETGAARLAVCLERLVATGHSNDWAPRAFREFASHWLLSAVTTDGLPWIEIDYPADLERARTEVEQSIRALESALVH